MSALESFSQIVHNSTTSVHGIWQTHYSAAFTHLLSFDGFLEGLGFGFLYLILVFFLHAVICSLVWLMAILITVLVKMYQDEMSATSRIREDQDEPLTGIVSGYDGLGDGTSHDHPTTQTASNDDMNRRWRIYATGKAGGRDLGSMEERSDDEDDVISAQVEYEIDEDGVVNETIIRPKDS